MKLTSVKSKSMVSGVLIAASLAFTASTAMAATAHKTAAATHVVHTRRVAAARRGPVGGYFGAGPGVNVGQLVGAMLGMVPPQYAGIVQSAMRQAALHRPSGTYESSGTYDPSFDSPSASTPIDNSASDAAAAAAAAASEQNLNDSMALTASMAAAEQENDAANAATLQTEINAGM